MKACVYLLCFIGVSFLNTHAYKAGVADSNNVAGVLDLIREAGEKNVDILLVPSDITNTEKTYDDVVKALSKATKQAGLYLIAHLNELTLCQKKREFVRSNLVFDRQGTIIAGYRKPTITTENCTATASSSTFSTDFGVLFSLMMEEDLVLKRPELNGNYVVAGVWRSEIPFLSASQFTSSWAYTADANVLSGNGIFAGKAGLKTRVGSLITTHLKNNKQEVVSTPPVVNPAVKNFPGEDLNQYIFRPMNIEASDQGYTDSVCHNSFCCQFYVKTVNKGPKQEVNYGLAAFDGIRHYGGSQYIGTQNCAVFACAGLYKKSCRIGSVSNNTNIIFEKLSVTANFTTENSAQYPMILSNNALTAGKFNFITESVENTKKVTIEVTDADNLYAFGIFGRDYENDYERIENKEDSFGIYDYIFTEDMQELFDYVWIRLRILLFIVSIYVLEML